MIKKGVDKKLLKHPEFYNRKIMRRLIGFSYFVSAVAGILIVVREAVELYRCIKDVNNGSMEDYKEEELDELEDITDIDEEDDSLDGLDSDDPTGPLEPVDMNDDGLDEIPESTWN